MNIQSDNWIFVSEENDVEVEDILRLDHENKTYCIYRLEDGLVMDDEIECPMHQGIFNIKTGKAISPPVCEDLKTYSVKVEEGKIYIQII